MRTLISVGAAVAVLLAVAGCAGKVTKTPEGTTRAYVNYMKAGKWLDAAKLWDYSEYAKRENSDWDTFGEEQRKLITNKLAEEKAKSLEMWGSKLADLKVETVQTNGTDAHAILTGAISSLDLSQFGDAWLITNMN